MSEALDLAALDDAGFARLYEARIKPCFDAHEPERVAAVETFKRRLMIGAPIVLLLAAIVGFGFRLPEFAFFALIAGGFIVYGIAYSKLAQVQAKVKEASCSAVAESIGVTFSSSLADPPAFARLRALQLLPGHDRAKFEDWFRGEHRGSSFDLYEAHLEQRHRDNKGRTRWTTVFRGQVVRLKFPREFLGVTVVLRDAGIFNIFGAMGGQNWQRIGLEDPKFEKAFEVYGSDQVEARYLVHPVLMERLMALEAAFKGKRLRCAFEKGDMLIAVEGGNLFEPGDMFKPLADPVRAKKLVDEIGKVMSVMDAVLTAQARRS
ncbi:MAG: DUF3137 domain-containing protein [Hyphomonadaceae bacterium]